MTDEQFESELARWNAIPTDEAHAIANELEGQTPAFRSCGHCNGAHDRLMERGVLIRCFACGVMYVSGIPAPALGYRMRNEAVPREGALQWREAVENPL